MATRPTIVNIPNGAIFDATSLNGNFEANRDNFDNVVGTAGTGGSNNTMTANFDMGGNTILNALFDGDIAGLEWKSDWTTTTAYDVNDVVRDTTANVVYIANTDHTSSGAEPISTNVDSGKWDIMLSSPLAGSGTVTSIATGDGITGGTITTSGTVSIDLGTNPGLILTGTKLLVNPGTGIALSSGGVDLDINSLVEITSVEDNLDFVAIYDTSASAIKKIKPTNLLSIGIARNYIDGLIMSNDTDTAHDISVTAGIAMDSTNAQSLTLASVMVKQIDVDWVAGTGQGGFPSGLSLSTTTWYHMFVVDSTSGAVDSGYDTSLSATNLLSDTGGTLFRRIGSVLTDGSSNILGFTQYPKGEFWWDSPILDVNDTSSGTSAKTATLTVPLGVVVKAIVNMAQHTGTSSLYLSSLDVTDQAASRTIAPLGQASPADGMSQALVWTNTSKQIRYRTEAGSNIDVATVGWVDPRGRDS